MATSTNTISRIRPPLASEHCRQIASRIANGAPVCVNQPAANIATNSDRTLSRFVDRVRASVKASGGNDDQTFACMASIVAESRTPGDVQLIAESLGALIAEHG